MSQSIDAKHDPKLRKAYQQQLEQGGVNSKEMYDLFGVVVHMGGGCRSGHYYSYCKDFQGNWFECDDSSVTRSSIDQAMRQQAYILFY